MEEIKIASKLLPVYRKTGDALIVPMRGEIDLHNSPEVRKVLLGLLAKDAPKRLVLNLADVPYMDSSGIAVLVEALQKLRKSGGKIYLTNLQPRVKGLLEIARLHTVFVCVADEAEALK